MPSVRVYQAWTTNRSSGLFLLYRCSSTLYFHSYYGVDQMSNGAPGLVPIKCSRNVMAGSRRVIWQEYCSCWEVWYFLCWTHVRFGHQMVLSCWLEGTQVVYVNRGPVKLYLLGLLYNLRGSVGNNMLFLGLATVFLFPLRKKTQKVQVKHSQEILNDARHDKGKSFHTI